MNTLFFDFNRTSRKFKFHDQGRMLCNRSSSQTIFCDFFPEGSTDRKKGKKVGREISCLDFLSYHTNHLTLTFRIKILPWISTYSWWKNFRMKRQAKEEKKEK
jgi:hypothetical protein